MEYTEEPRGVGSPSHRIINHSLIGLLASPAYFFSLSPSLLLALRPLSSRAIRCPSPLEYLTNFLLSSSLTWQFKIALRISSSDCDGIRQSFSIFHSVPVLSILKLVQLNKHSTPTGSSRSNFVRTLRGCVLKCL